MHDHLAHLCGIPARSIICALSSDSSLGWNRRIKQKAENPSDEGAMFAQSSGDDSWKTDITYFGCGKQGHLKRECPNKKDKDQIHANIIEEEDPDDGENIIAQQKLKGMVNENYLLLHQKSNHVPYYLFIVIIHLGNMYYGVTDTFLT